MLSKKSGKMCGNNCYYFLLQNHLKTVGNFFVTNQSWKKRCEFHKM
jgi:hypothetical protein